MIYCAIADIRAHIVLARFRTTAAETGPSPAVLEVSGVLPRPTGDASAAAATADADPGYHTGLSLIDAIAVIEGL